MHKRNSSYSLSFFNDRSSNTTYPTISKSLFLSEIWQYFSENWQEMKKHQNILSLVEQGIPPALRKTIWPLALPNQLVITSELYEIFLNQANTYMDQNINYQKQAKISSIANIEIDITRTNHQLKLFGDNSPMRQNLRNILQAFIFMRPDIGYVQGMSYIAGIFLMYFDELNAFIRFSNLVTSKFLINIYKFNFEVINENLQEFKQLFKQNLPRLYKHFQEQEILEESYMLEWLLTLYSKSLNPDTICRVWDIIFIQGLGILSLKEPQLVKKNIDGIYQILKNIKDIQEDDLVQKIKQIKI